MADVPYISQLGNGPRNDCGPACALMLARSIGKGLGESVERWSKELPRGIDADDDGTTATELARMLEKLDCAPVVALDAPYPHIALVDYAALPVAQRYDQSGRTFGHWIVRLSDTTYHDPYHTHGGQVADKAALDKAVLDGAAKYWGGFVAKIGLNPAIAPVTATALVVSGTGGAGVNVRAAGALTGQKIGVLAEGREVKPVAEASGWTQIALVKEPPSWVNGWVKSDYLTALPPPAPAPVQRQCLVGVNVISDTGALAEAERAGCKFALVLGGNKEAADFARSHPDGYCMVRADVKNGRWAADDFIRALGVSADMPPNLVLTLFNEADSWGSSPSELEERTRVETEFVRKARAIGCRAIIALGTFSVGNPQFASSAPEYADTVRLIKQYYAPLWDAGEIGLDYHAYAPNKQHIYSDEGLPWFETRWQFFFTDCGLDPTKGQGVFIGECGVDEDGIGGFKAHGASTEDVAAHIRRVVEIQSRPLVVAGREYPSPVKGAAVFCYGNNGDPRWKNGYDIRPLGTTPFVKAGVWVGARGMRKAMKPKG
jgi:hypothetical protein